MMIINIKCAGVHIKDKGDGKRKRKEEWEEERKKKMM
jgi:hypothetical protein